MSTIEIIEILRKSGLKRTPIRQAVFEHLVLSQHALSQPDIEQKLGHTENRVTVYRVLKDLEEKGLIHRIFDLEGTARFAPCKTCAANAQHVHQHADHTDEHLHFNCTACKNVYCLSEVSMSIPILPQGFHVQNMRCVVEGICPDCLTKI